MKRLYADFNDVAADRTLALTCAGSLDSIAALKDALAEGERVVLCDEELEVSATLERRSDGSWQAHSDWIFRAVGQGRDV